MSSRFADPATMRTRSPIYHDDSPKRPPPSPSNKAPPPKKVDTKSRAVSEEPSLSSKMQAVISPSSDPHAASCPDKLSGNRVVVDMEVFEQILELDEAGSQEFSRNMVEEYLDQTTRTMEDMDASFAKHTSSMKHEELTKLGKYGHFLKGSSAALGVVQVQEICEKIQHLGNRMDPDKDPEVKLSVDDAFARIKPLLARLKDEQPAAAKCLNGLLDGPHP